MFVLSTLPSSLLLVVLLALAGYLKAERVAIQAGKSFCVFEDLKANVPWGIQFQSDEHEIKVVVGKDSSIYYTYYNISSFSHRCVVLLKFYITAILKLTVLIQLKLKWTVVTRFASKILRLRFKKFPLTF